jgi:hypothetical protein
MCEHLVAYVLRQMVTYDSTAGEMLEGPGGPRGSFSRKAFSDPAVLLVVMVVCESRWTCGERVRK